MTVVPALGIQLCLALCLQSFADSTPSRLLAGVEEHYNRAKTLEVSFEETYLVQGHARKSEAGELYLRKPGRMRWEYRNPAGKLFLSDGKYVYYFTPAANRIEKMSLKETSDMRAPLAFLLGKLELQRDFTGFELKSSSPAESVVTARPKSDRVPYSQVEFAVTPQMQIHRLDVTSHDGSVLSFLFSNEKVNPEVSNELFRLRVPAGVALVDSSELPAPVKGK